MKKKYLNCLSSFVLYTTLLICITALPASAQSADEMKDLAARWRASMDAAERSRVDALKPDVHIEGSHYTDSAYRIGFYFSPGDSIINRSGAGAALIIITNGFYYLRMSTINSSSSVKDYAEKQHDEAKANTPAGIKNYKAGKLKKGENRYCFCYSYRVTYTDKTGADMVAVVRMQYGIVKLVATFPNDAAAAAKEEKLNDLANSVSTW